MSAAAQIGVAPRPGMKRRALRLAQAGLWLTGTAPLYGRKAGADRLTILMYHSVAAGADAAAIAPRNRMDPERFERQMRYLAGTGRVVKLDDLVAGRARPARPIVLTFDDGYRDNLTVVAPILSRLGVPAVLYLATGYLAGPENQWADRLYAAFVGRTRHRLAVDKTERDLAEADAEAEAWSELTARLMAADMPERAELLERVEEDLAPAGAPPRLTLTWDEAKTLRDEHPDFALGIHTSGHVDLSARTREAALAEVDLSIREFTDELGVAPRHFSYPYSRALPELAPALRERGLQTAMTGEGTVAMEGMDPMDLCRVESPEAPVWFRYLASGAHPRLSEKVFGRA